jgi:hypothetical protein
MEQRAWVGRRLTTGRRHMQRLMTSLASDRVALQDATSDIWAGVSHPGAPIDPATALRLAREGAVVAARVGSRLNDFDTVTGALFADLTAADEVDTALGEALARTEVAITELRALTSAEPLADERANAQASAPRTEVGAGMGAGQSRRPATPNDPFATNILETQRRRTGKTPAVAPDGAPRQTGGYRAVRRDSSQHRALLGERDATGQTPAAGQSQQGRRPNPNGQGASGAYRQQSKAGSSGRHNVSNSPQPPRAPRQAPDERSRGSSGSRWLND